MKITVAQLNYHIGDFEGNFNKISAVIQKNHLNSDLIVFSELCLSGYSPQDLLERPDFIQIQDLYLNKIIDSTKNLDCGIVLGAITRNIKPGKPLFNSLMLIFKGHIIYTYHKKLLPVYNIFDEARHFEPGPLDDNGIFEFKNTSIGFLICEDAWSSHAEYFNPTLVDVVITINASPSHVGKQEERLLVFSKIAQKAQAPLLFCNQVGGNDDIVFDGGSFCLNANGDPVANLPYFQSATRCIDMHTLNQASQTFYHLKSIDLIYQQLLLGLNDYIKKCHFKGVVLGLSGGIDSALTLALAVQALGSGNVKAIFMPTRYTSAQSQEDSVKLCQHLKVELFHINIDTEFEACLNQFKEAFYQEPTKITRQNIQARIRGRLLMSYSNQTGFLLLSTGNKSELSCGYTTLYGDMAGGLNLIGDLYKSDVYKLARFINTQQSLSPLSPSPSPLIPFSIIERAPTAELDYNQKDSDDLLPYPQLDAILKLYIEGDLISESERRSLETITSDINPDLILKIHKMVNQAEFKRRQSAPIIRVQKRAFGQGRRMPISAFMA